LVDDSVQNKQYSQAIETVKLQYIGNEHGLVKEIGLVNLVHTSGAMGDFYPVNYRVYNPDSDGKSKMTIFKRCFCKQLSIKKLRHEILLLIVDMQVLIT
jgi:hypothetical protein